jgi:hypothetical protein
MRIIVAGSRDWSRPDTVYAALQVCVQAARECGQRLTVVHGHTKSGAEYHADEWAMAAAGEVGSIVDWPERYPAQWMGKCRATCPVGTELRPHRRPDPGGWTTCPSAGYFRTDDMVAKGAHLVLAFVAVDDRGPRYCVKAATDAGIDHQWFELTTRSGLLSA